jgi:hypothetical protein
MERFTRERINRTTRREGKRKLLRKYERLLRFLCSSLSLSLCGSRLPMIIEQIFDIDDYTIRAVNRYFLPR